MISSRCIACFTEYPQNAPSFCRCGGSAFTAIHSDDEPEAPTTSPEGGRSVVHSTPIAASVLGQLQSFGPMAAASTGPTPPPSVSDSSGSASAPQPGAADEPDESETDVGGAECQTCRAAATHQTESLEGVAYLCDEHARQVRAAGVAVQPL